jgi:hypothetical protein
MASALEIVQVLRELKESIEKQGTLLGTLISRLEVGKDAQEADQEIDQHTPHATPESDDEHGDGREAVASASEGTGEVTGNDASNSDGLRTFAKLWIPWVSEWAAFYRFNGLLPGRICWNMEEWLANTITDVSPQPRIAVATSRWRYCKCHLRCLVVLYCLGT